MKQLLCIFMMGTMALFANAQTNTYSPYSYYGIGDPSLSSNTVMASMGHAQIALVSPTIVNSMNPASYTDITRPAFNFDLKNEFLTLSSGIQNQSSSSFSINNFSFAFPILNNHQKYKRRMGLSFGITPYTNMGYNLSTVEEVPDIGTVEYMFFGEGSLNTVHMGLGYDLLANKDRTNTLSAGANVNYVFGRLTRNRVTQFSNTSGASNIYRHAYTEVSDVDFNVGIRFAHIDTITRKILIRDSTYRYEKVLTLFSVGGYIRPASDLTTFAGEIDYSFSDSAMRALPIDSINATTVNGLTTTPLVFGVGASFNIGNKWVMALDYHQRNSSGLSSPGVTSQLFNTRRVSFGLEFTPDYNGKATGQYLKMVRYRTGWSVAQTAQNIDGAQPIRYGINFGLGFPLWSASLSSSMFNIGMEVAQRSVSTTDLNENFFNLQAGFVITPHRFDQWFAKRKYD